MLRKPLTNDSVFKIVMKKNKDVLKILIEGVYNIEVKDMVLLDPKQIKNVYVKSQECDLVVFVNSEYYFNIEMDNKKNNVKNHLYSSGLMGNQLKTGDDYKLIKPVIQIVLANYHHFKKGKGKSKVIFMEEEHKQIDNLSFEKWVVNLKKIRKQCYNKENKTLFEKVISIMKAKDLTEMKDIAKGDGLLEMMVNDYEIATEKSELMDLMCQVDYNELQRQYDLGKAHEAGIARGHKEGLTRGREEANIATVKKMIAKGFEVSDIAELTSLDEERVLTLKRNFTQDN